MRKYKLTAVVLALVALSVSGVGANSNSDEKGYQIAKNVDDANNGFVGDYAELEMILYDAHKNEIVRKMYARSMETENSGDRSINTFAWPADIKGTRLLTWTYMDKEDDDQWMYLPVAKRVKRISSSNKTGSFMGSEFTYEDVGGNELNKYEYNYIGEDELKGRETWVVERFPTSPRSGYSKQKVWFDKEYMSILQIEYYDRKEELQKISSYEDFKKFDRWWRAQKLTMNNVKTQKSSVILWTDYKLGIEYDEDEFNPDSLQD